MRKLKLRAWDKTSQKWLGQEGNAFRIDLDGCYYPELPDGQYDFSIDCTKIEVVMYSGVNDKNGIEIHEGCVIRYPNPTCMGIVRFGEYSWSDGSEDSENGNGFYIERKDKYMKVPLTSNLSSCLEIIGNIYENPDMDI